MMTERHLEHSIIDVLPKWGKYEVNGAINAGGKPYKIVYIMAHHVTDSVWLVVRHGWEQEMYEYDIDYDSGLPKEDKYERMGKNVPDE